MTDATNNAAANAPAEAGKEKQLQAFYSRRVEGQTQSAVSLFLLKKEKGGAPDVDGWINGTHVAGWIQNGRNGGFISFKADRADKDANGHSPAFGTGNVFANNFGIPKLKINLAAGGEPVWAEVSLKMSQEHQDVLVAAGLDLQKQAEKKAAAAERKAAQPEGAPA